MKCFFFLSKILKILPRNEKIARFHNILTPNLYIRVFPNGDVLYSIRWVSNELVKWKKYNFKALKSEAVEIYFPRDKAWLFVNTKESEIVTLWGRGKTLIWGSQNVLIYDKLNGAF